MALIHDAVLRPSKTEILSAWAPTQPWFSGENLEVTRVASFRFDDPDGDVGIETLLVRAGTGPLLQVPLTYRGEPLAGGEAWLIGTLSHSVLGERWVYDAVGDPAYLHAVAPAPAQRLGARRCPSPQCRGGTDPGCRRGRACRHRSGIR